MLIAGSRPVSCLSSISGWRTATLGRLLAAVGALALLVGVAGAPANAANEAPSDYNVEIIQKTHWYELEHSTITLPFGTPFVSVTDAAHVLTLDWDFESGYVNVHDGTFVSLGALDLPGGARVLDLLALPDQSPAGRAHAMVSYSFLDPATGCRHSQLRAVDFDLSGAGDNRLGQIWFTSPCYPNNLESSEYALTQSGGRIVSVPKAWRMNQRHQEYFLSIGDFGLTRAPELVPTARGRELLSTIVHLTQPGRAEIWSRGLRNAQGLTIATIDGEQKLIATFHGPRGGDELVIADKGTDFGWPKANYGHAYGKGGLSSTPVAAGSLRNSDRPLFAWVPAIAPSSVIQLKGPASAQWWQAPKNATTSDVMVAGMGARSLIRLRVDQGAVRYEERILTGARMRTLTQMPSGVLVMGLDAGNDLLLATPRAVYVTGEEAFVPVA